MAFGLTYVSPSITGCIESAYKSSLNTIFVAAAGSTTTEVIFPANMDCCVLAVSMVEVVDNDGYRLMGRPGTVSYGPSVDYVSASSTKGIPASGMVGNSDLDEIARFSWSSAATGTYAGLIGLVSAHAATSGWTRDNLLAVLRSCSSVNNITDFNGEPVEAVVGHGLLDVYCAIGGLTDIEIVGPSSVQQGANLLLRAHAPRRLSFDVTGHANLRFTWTVNGVGAGVGPALTLNTSAAGFRRVRLTVTDLVEGKSFSAERVFEVTVPSDQKLVALRTLGSERVVADWATFLNGGRHDRIVNAGARMPIGCKVTRVLGVLVDSSGVPEPGRVPKQSDDAGSHGFTINRDETLDTNDLQVTVHQWHDGLSAVRTRPVYVVEQPAGTDCLVPGVLKDY
jgi:hypothetical protein